MAYSQAMTLADLIAEVQGLRFTNGNATQITRWINDRYAALWGTDEWTFKYAQTAVTATDGDNQLSGIPSDFGIALGVWRADGVPMRWVPPKAFEDLYTGSSSTGGPEFYTIIDQTIYVGPTSNETSSSYTLLYQRRLTPLVLPTDVPVIPPERHYLLVTGALAFGLMLNNDFTYQFLQQGWQQGIDEMRREWLNDQRGDSAVWGRDTVEALPTAWGI